MLELSFPLDTDLLLALQAKNLRRILALWYARKMKVFMPFFGLMLALTSTTPTAMAEKSGRYGCVLTSKSGAELESLMMTPQNEIHQYVTPDRKFFIELKKAIVSSPNPPSGQLVPKNVIRLRVSLYSDFAAHYGSTAGLLDQQSRDFTETEPELLLEVNSRAPAPVETFKLKCTRLIDVNLPKILHKTK